jgi:hypothetical protein
MRRSLEEALHSYKVGTGTTVRFRLRDVVCPDLDRLISNIGPELALQGEIVFLSDHGDERDHFAIIELEGMSAPVIVPLSMVTHPTEFEPHSDSA